MDEESMLDDIVDEAYLENFEKRLANGKVVCFIAAALMYIMVYFLWAGRLSTPIGKITVLGYSKSSVRTWQEVMELMAFCFMPEILASLLERCHGRGYLLLSAVANALRTLLGTPAMATMGIGMAVVVLGAESVGVVGKIAVMILALPMVFYAFIVVFQHLWSVGTVPEWEE